MSQQMFKTGSGNFGNVVRRKIRSEFDLKRQQKQEKDLSFFFLFFPHELPSLSPFLLSFFLLLGLLSIEKIYIHP